MRSTIALAVFRCLRACCHNLNMTLRVGNVRVAATTGIHRSIDRSIALAYLVATPPPLTPLLSPSSPPLPISCRRRMPPCMCFKVKKACSPGESKRVEGSDLLLVLIYIVGFCPTSPEIREAERAIGQNKNNTGLTERTGAVDRMVPPSCLRANLYFGERERGTIRPTTGNWGS